MAFSIFCLYKVLFIKMRKRNKQFVIRLSDSEWNHLNELVKYSGQSRESYLRMCINGLVPRPAPSVELVEVTQVLRQIAESINKIKWMIQFIWKIMRRFKNKLTKLCF